MATAGIEDAVCVGCVEPTPRMLRRNCNALSMKTATFPSLRVEPSLRQAAESVLREGETLTGLIETAMRETIHRRRVQDEFVARGLRARDEASRTGIYHASSEVHAELQARLDARRKRVLGRKAAK